MASPVKEAASPANDSGPAPPQPSPAPANSLPPRAPGNRLPVRSAGPLRNGLDRSFQEIRSPSASPSPTKERISPVKQPKGPTPRSKPDSHFTPSQRAGPYSGTSPNPNSRGGASFGPRRSVPASPRIAPASQPNGRRGPPVHNSSSIQLSSAHLKDASSIHLKLSGLPTNITTREIYASLAKHGLSIGRIDIFENHQNVRNGTAFVDIEPPPSRWPPWEGPQDVCTIHRKGSRPVLAQVSNTRTTDIDEKVRTPLNHHVPRQVSFECRGLLFGMMAREDAMFKLPQYEYRNVRLDLQFHRRFIQISFTLALRSSVKWFKLPIKFSHIKKMVRVNKKDECAVIIQLPSPPELLARMDDVLKSHDDGLDTWQDRDAWQRQVEITDQPGKAKRQPAQLTKNRKTVDIAQWTTYYLNVSPSVLDTLTRHGARLRDYNVNMGSMDSFDLVVPGQSVWTLLNPDPTNSFSWYNQIHLPFEIRYQLEVCISQGLLNEYSIDENFLNRLLNHESGAPRELDRVRMMLEGVADQNIQYYRPADIFDNPKIVHYWPSVKLPSQAALVRRAVVTPTGIYFKTPGVELTNRILRKYSDLSDRFLRVQFTDEMSFGALWSCQGSRKSDKLYSRVLRVLLNGIVIGDRHYKILAWSNSQFREHGAFFFCANDHVSCDDIREWMGDLTHIRSVGKFAARMGQCFTTTRQLSGVSVPRIVEMQDIERETDGQVWNFTDGVGKISPFFAQMIAHEQDMVDTPSCFQFRMGGCKGVVVVWPDVPASEVHIRPSQEKFKAPYNGLEIIKVSRFSQATLNRQIIPILSCLGVDTEVFLTLLEEELEEYRSAMTDSYKASALLRQRVDENQISLVLANMVDTFMDAQEPFMCTILRLWECWALQRLKYKAAISVKKSAFLYGCVDELGVLRGHSAATEGKGVQDRETLPQIFLQIPKEGTDPNNLLNYVVVTGLCVVGRNPSLHPGDIRVVEAVDVPGLRHLKNVVVFPQTGDRDIPSMCSGGDLDGDDFFVFWDERLLPKTWDFPPMVHDAEAAAPGADGNDININDMCAFFARYMKNDCVGLVASAHFALADRFSPSHDKCIQLAKLHSAAVDYIKSGKEAVMPRSLNVKISPHWMERKKGKFYRSQKPVGLIYDRINVEKFNPAYDMPFDNRIISRFDLSAEELAKAKQVKARYDIAMRRLMGQHERPVSEFEIWSTFVLSKPRVGNDYKLQEEVGRQVSALKDRFRQECGEAVTGVAQTSAIFSYAKIDLAQLDRFVAAMYTVTHAEVQAALEERALPLLDAEGNKLADDQGPDFPMPLISFPWLFHTELARIARGGVPPAMWSRKKADAAAAAAAGAGPEEMSPESRAKVASRLGSQFVVGGEDHRENVVMGKKERAAAAEGDGDNNVAVNGDTVRTASGKEIRRGEILRVFENQDGAVDGGDDAAVSRLEPGRSVQEGEGGLDVVEVADSEVEEGGVGGGGGGLEGGNVRDQAVHAASDDNTPASGRVTVSGLEGVEVVDSDDDEEEDELGEMARKLAGGK